MCYVCVVGCCFVLYFFFLHIFVFFFKQKTAYAWRISDWSSDVCSSDLPTDLFEGEVSGKVGNRANKEIGAIVNIPLAEGLAARATYNFRNISDGAGTNRALNRPLANVKSHFARGKLKYEDRKRVDKGKRVAVCVDLGDRRIIKKKRNKQHLI